MGKAGKWLKHFLTSKKDKGEKDVKDKKKVTVAAAEIIAQNACPVTPVVYPPTTPREKKRWSFRRSSATSAVPLSVPAQPGASDVEDDQKNHTSSATSAVPLSVPAQPGASDVEDDQKNHTMISLTAAVNGRSSPIEETAAVKIQSVFRSYLARKALCALRGLVKLQALVRGHLVRKRAKATLRCMQALVTAQARARAQHFHSVNDTVKPSAVRPSTPRKSTQFRNVYQEIDRGMMEENIKIVEMDRGDSRPSAKSRNSCSYPNHTQIERMHCPVPRSSSNQDNYQRRVSPAPLTQTELGPRTCSGHFEHYAFCTAQSSPQCYSAMSKPDPTQIPFSFPRPEYAELLSYDCPFYPNYMANTESSRAKARSQSVPKQRPPDYFERQASRRRLSMEGKGVPRGSGRMQRLSSQVGSDVQGYQHSPWSVKQLDQSSVSLKGSECGSTTSTVTRSTNYCRSFSFV